MKVFKSEHVKSVIANTEGYEFLEPTESGKKVYLNVYDTLDSLLVNHHPFVDTEETRKLREQGLYVILDTKNIRTLSCVGDEIQKFKDLTFDSVCFDEQGSFKGEVINYLIKGRVRSEGQELGTQ